MRSSIAILLFCVLTFVSARTINWTGTAGNSLWGTANNWEGNSLPTKDDDVIVNPVGGASVTVSQPSVAKSITIGGGTYTQTLTLLSSLEVGDGGITINSRGTLQLSGNNDLPLSSTGPVAAKAGGSIIFNSGDIQGPGAYSVASGADIVFSGSALKLIEGADLTVYGVATIQPTTIQLAKGATFTNNGGVVAVGLVNIFSNDNSKASFYSYGNFTYQGTAAAQPLTFQLDTYFSGDLSITSGAVILNGYFYSIAGVTLPLGTSITVRSGETLKKFTNIQGAGSLIVEGAVEVTAILDISWVTVSDSGSLTLSGTATTKIATKSLSVSGKLIIGSGASFTATDVSLVAGTVTGAGQLSASGNFEIAVSQTGNVNNFIAAIVNVEGTGFTTGSPYILFADAGNLYVKKGATFKIGATAHFGKQTGSPVVTNDGTFSIQLEVGGTFDSNVDLLGTGDLKFVSGLITFQADTVTSNSIDIEATALVVFQSAVITTGSVGGSGSLNVSAAPTPTSVFGDVVLSYFGVPNGNVQVKSIAVATLEIFSGVVTVADSTANKATKFNFYGGQLSGAKATLATSSLLITGDIPQILDGVAITADQFSLKTITTGTIISQNGAQINVGVKTNSIKIM